MRSLAFVLLAACSSQPDVITARQLPAAIAGDAAAIVASNNQFAVDVLHKQNTDNVIFSPFSISTALAMLDAGAAGQTDSELRTALHFTLPGAQTHAAYGALLASLDTGRSYGAYQLATADRLFGQQGFPFTATYLDTTKTDYQAELMPLDFESAPDTARGTVNQWVATQTDNKIPQLFPQGSITSDTRLVLANAIVFKGQWDAQFDPAKTQTGNFHVAGGADVSAPLMHANRTLATARITGGQLGVFPFRGKDIALVVMLPDAPDGLPQLEASLTGDAISQAVAAAAPLGEAIDVTLPKFSFEQDQSLNALLQSLGVVTAFDPTAADFSGIDGMRDLFVQSAIHDAVITVDEEGAEAAAATGISVGTNALPPSFTADHSFAFAIFDNVTGSILFLGHVADPTRS